MGKQQGGEGVSTKEEKGVSSKEEKEQQEQNVIREQGVTSKEEKKRKRSMKKQGTEK